MGLNIKNPETYRLVEELAKRTGESMTAAVTIAVRERLERVRGEQGAGLAERLLRIGQDCAKRLKEPYRSASHDALLYDDRGLRGQLRKRGAAGYLQQTLLKAHW
jgi:antitoxin VapB